MDSRKHTRNYPSHHHHQQPQSQQHHQPQQQQQNQRQPPHHNHQIDAGRVKGATRILNAQQQLIDQHEQHLNKPPEEQLTVLDPAHSGPTFNSPPQPPPPAPTGGGSDHQPNSHIGAPQALPAPIERCNSNIYEARGDMHSSAGRAAAAASTNNVNMLYLDQQNNGTSGGGGGCHINPSSSSYNLQSYSSSNSAAAQPIRVDTNSPSAINNNNNNNIRYDSPQVQPCDIKALFECPICFDYAVPPIYQCQNGHLVCQSCSNKIAHCPTCRVPITEPGIRNLQLDKLANQFQFPCKYNFVGCHWKSYWFKKRDHEDVCEYISYSCPCPGTSCKWTGLLPQVMPHLSEQHKSITTLSGEDIVFLATDINLKGAVDWVMIQSCFEHHFLLVLEKQENKNGFFAVVQLIGTPKEAEKFKYKLELSTRAKRLTWEAHPRSILDGIQFSIANNDCLVFDARTAQHFLSPIKRDNNNNGNSDNNSSQQSENLGINVTIERVAQ